jgi:hypothetical protein
VPATRCDDVARSGSPAALPVAWALARVRRQGDERHQDRSRHPPHDHNRQPFEVRMIYCSSVSAPVPGFASRSDEMGVAVRIVSYSVTTTTPGTGTSTTCLGDFLGAFLAAIFDGRCFLAMGFAAPLTARWTLDFGFFGVVLFATFLRAGSALGLPRFEFFLRVATRFFALAMIVPCEYAASTPISNQANYADIILSVIRHATFIPHPAGNTLHDARERQKARTTRRSRNSTGALPPQAPPERVRRDANGMVDTLCCQRDTDFVGQNADDLASWHVRIERWR